MLTWIWVLTILGAALTWILMLADAMSSGPRLPLGLAAVALPLPLIAVGLSSRGLQTAARTLSRLRSCLAFGFPLLVNLGMLAVWIGFFWPKSG